jgi:hypothetical protein
MQIVDDLFADESEDLVTVGDDLLEDLLLR